MNKWLIFLVIFATGCLSEVNLDPQGDFNDSLVINGKLTHGDTSTISVRVHRLLPRDRFTSTVPVFPDQVVLIDTDGSRYEVPAAQAGGGHFGIIPDDSERIRISPGRSYQLEVTMPDGRVYRSAVEPLEQVPPIQSVRLERRQDEITNSRGEVFSQDLLVFQVETSLDRPDDKENARLIWSLAGTFQLTESPGNPESRVCYLSFTLSPSDFPLVNGADLTSGETVFLDVYQTGVDFRFAEGFQLSIRQESLSENALDYWAQVKRVLNRTGTIAEEPVGEVIGNWTSADDPDEVVYGLFYAVDQTSSDVFVHPGEVGNPANFCPQPVFDAETANLCNDCQAAWPEGDSRLVPPDDWGG